MSKYKIFRRTEKSMDYNHRLNQDRSLFFEFCFNNDIKIKILIIADGMGGLEDGEKAATNAVNGCARTIYEKILETYMNVDVNDKYFSMENHANNLSVIVCEAIRAANIEVCKNTDRFVQSGSTISVVAIMDRCATVCNTGDSPVYFYKSKTNELSLVSKLHTLAESNVENGIYARYSKAYYNDDHILTHCLGEQSELLADDISVTEISALEEGDMFLCGSDGAFGRMNEDEISEIILDKDEYKILDNLFKRARKDKHDDQTALLYKIC